MDGARGFSSTTGSFLDKASPRGDATRANSVNPGMRLRQKPAVGAATPQDFFASLGVDTTSRERTGSSASTSSNRSYSSTAIRRSSPSGIGSFTPTSSPSAWRRSPIGGLRTTPVLSSVPFAGALSDASVIAATTTTTATTTSCASRSSGLSGVGFRVGRPGAAPVLAATTNVKPTQLFSMEDAEDLYNDDEWKCDSPLTMLSNPTDETDTTRVVATGAIALDDEFVWDDKDDEFASSVTTATMTSPNTNKIPVTGAFETKEVSMTQQVASEVTENRFTMKNGATTKAPYQETKVQVEQARTVSAVLPPPAAMPSTSCSTTVTSRSCETTGDVESTRPLPPLSTNVSSIFLPAKLASDAFDVTSYEAPSQAAASTKTSVSRSVHLQNEQWDDRMDRKEPVNIGSKMIATNNLTIARKATVTTTAATRTGAFMTPPVELTSPDGTAGEFWGDGDGDELLDSDNHADDKWNESMTDQATESKSLDSSFRHKNSHVESTTLAFSSQDTSFSLPYRRPPLEVSVNLEESVSMAREPVSASNSFLARQLEKINNSSQTDMVGHVSEVAKMDTIGSPAVPSLAKVSSTKQNLVIPVHSVTSSQTAKQNTSIGTDSAPFPSAIAESAIHENDRNVFSEAPRNACFLHTPTGTGGPFGRVPSPHVNENSTFLDEVSGTDANEADHTSMAFPSEDKDEVPDSNTSVRWDPRLLHECGDVRMSTGEQANGDDDQTHYNTHDGPNADEERDSVVSFSGENSFFPSTGRPSSLNGGSQSSFASHRMYQSSIASTDHEGSSIASFGVSSAGATFGGSERVSEGGAFSDGTMSETPSMVDSSNASTAFGTDFPSVSEGQFSAPGTTIGGSENASDGGFSDDNASETASICGSVNTNLQFVSEYSSSNGRVMETVEHCGIPEPFALPTPESQSVAQSIAAVEVSAPVAAAPIFEGDDSDTNLFVSPPSVFSSSQYASDASPATALTGSNSSRWFEGDISKDNVQSAAFLFGATAGSDVPNPFDSFGASPAVTEVKTVDAHQPPSQDVGDLFGSAPSSGGFENSFACSKYQTHDQSYKQAGNRFDFADPTLPLSSTQSQLSFTNSNDRPTGGKSLTSSFQPQRSSNNNRANPFVLQGAQLSFGNSAPSAENVYGNGEKDSRPNVGHGVSSYFGGDVQASANAVFSRSKSSSATASDRFGQQSSIDSSSLDGDQRYDHYGHRITATYSEKPLVAGINDEHQPGANATSKYAITSGGFEPSHRRSSASSVPSNAALREASGFGRQSHYDRPAPGMSNSYSHQSAAAVYSSASHAERFYGSQQTEQQATFGAANNYSHHSKDLGRASPVQSADFELQDNNYPRAGETTAHGPAGGFHSRSSSSASTDAFFDRLPAVEPLSSASNIGGERVSFGPARQQSVQQRPPVLPGSQSSLLRNRSDTYSYAEQDSGHILIKPNATRPPVHDLNASYGSIEDTSLSRYGSSSSIKYGSDTSLQPQCSVQQQGGSTSAGESIDASSFFGVAPSVTSGEVSSGFGSNMSQYSSEMVTAHSQASASNASSMRTVFQSTPVPHQEHDSSHEWSYRDTKGECAGRTTATIPVSEAEAIPRNDSNSSSEMSHARRDGLQQHEATSNVGSPSVAKTDSHTASTGDSSIPTFTAANDVKYPQAINSSGYNVSSETSSDFFSSSVAPQTTASMSDQLKHKGYGQTPEQLQHQACDAAAASLQFSNSTLSYDQGRMHTPGEHSANYFDSRVPGAGVAGSASYSQQQPQQLQPKYQSFQQQPQQLQPKYQSFQQQQQQSELHDAASNFGYRDGVVQRQSQGTSYNNAAGQHEYGTVTRHGGYGQTTTQQTSHVTPTAALKTSNKYKDPCVAPPSCLASFGFGGNVVTMFPKRKQQSNTSESSFRNSSQSAPVLSELDNNDDDVLCKGPVSVYRMNQLHPKDSEFEQMDIFPGPLTEDVADETILECLDEYLKRSEAFVSAEEENDRLLLDVLRVLVKCNGKLRSDPGMLNPSDPDSPEAQLIALLSESSKRRNRNGPPTYLPPRQVQCATSSDLILKHANDLRELLLVGDREGAVASAVAAQMWPEAMLIASFTDKEAYRRVLRTYFDKHYTLGDPCRALFMSFADQQEKSVQEPKRLLQTNVREPAKSLILSNWVSHAQVLLSNRTADTNKILTELGDRLWGEANAVAAAHTCYLLAGIHVDAPTPSSKMALLGGDHRTPAEARFYVSPSAVQRTEIYEWVHKHAKGASANLMISFQGYKLIYAMLLADHGKLDTAFKYVTSMLAVIKAVTATTKPGTSLYLDGMKNQLTILDDRLRQHLGQDRVASVAAATSRGGGLKQSSKWGFGSALSIMGKIVNRVVEGSELDAVSHPDPSASSPGSLYDVTARAEDYPSTPSTTALASSSPTLSYPQQHFQQTPPSSSHGPSPIPTSFYGHATPPVSQSKVPVLPDDHNKDSVTPPAGPYARPSAPSAALLGPLSGNSNVAPQQQQPPSGPFSGNRRPDATGPFSNNGPGSQKHGTTSLRSQQSIRPPCSNHSTHTNSSFGMTPHGALQYSPQQQQHCHQQQPLPSQTSQQSQNAPPARPSVQMSSSLEAADDTSLLNQPETSSATGSTAEMATSVSPTDVFGMSGPASDKGKASPKLKGIKKSGRSKTPPPSGTGKGSGWLSGLSSFIATKMNPEVKVAKLGEQMEAYFDEDAKRWVFPGESASEEIVKPSAPPPGRLPGSAPGSSATGMPPAGTNSAPGSISSGPTPSNDPLAALMAPPPSRMLMKKDPLAAMMAPPLRPGMHGMRQGSSAGPRKPPRPQFAVFKPSAASSNEQTSG